MSFLLDPFAMSFVQRAFLGGALVAIVCGVVGTWVVLRGMAFLGEAMAHGMLPGIALAALTGIPPMVGAAVSATAMTLGIGALQRRGRMSADTSIGLLFVASLALGVIVVSASGSFATDATAILFGDILAISSADIALLAVAVAVALVVAVAGHRAFVALAVDPRQAQLLGLRPRVARVTLVALVTLAVVSAYQAVGSLLVVGMLLGPAVAAGQWARRIAGTMLLAAAIGVICVAVGLLVSWHAGTAAGATIAFTAIIAAGLSGAARAALPRGRDLERSAPHGPRPAASGAGPTAEAAVVAPVAAGVAPATADLAAAASADLAAAAGVAPAASADLAAAAGVAPAASADLAAAAPIGVAPAADPSTAAPGVAAGPRTPAHRPSPLNAGIRFDLEKTS